MTLYPSHAQTRRNVVSIWANRVLAILAPLITTPIIANHFGLEVAGVWLLASQLASQLVLLDAGLSNSLVRLLSRSRASGAPSDAGRIVATSFYALSAIGAGLLLLSPLVGMAYVRSFDLPTATREDALSLIVLTVVYVAISLPLRTGHGMLGSAHRFDVIQFWESAAVGARLGLVILVFMLGSPTVLHLGLIVFGSSLAANAGIFFHGLRLQGGRSALQRRHISRRVLREMLSMSMAALLVTLASVLLTQASATIAGYLLDTRAVALLSFPLLIYVSITPFFSTFAAIISPIAAGITRPEDKRRLLVVYEHTTRYLSTAAFGIFFLTLALGEPLLSLWLKGPGVSAHDVAIMADLLSILLLGFAVTMMAPLGRAVLSSVGWHWSAAMAELVTSATGIGLGLLLMTLADTGIRGMAIGIAAALALRGMIWFPTLMAAYFEVRVIALLGRCLGKPLLLAVLASACGLALDRLASGWGGQGLTQQSLVWGVPAVLWLVGVWNWILGADHRVAIAARLLPRRAD